MQKEAPPCRFFATNTCKKGSACTFRHVESDRLESSTRPSSSKFTKPCISYSSGRCKAGDACEFSHTPISTSDRKLNGLCRYYVAGECNLGLICRYFHPSKPERKSGQLCMQVLMPDGCPFGKYCRYQHPPRGWRPPISLDEILNTKKDKGGTESAAGTDSSDWEDIDDQSSSGSYDEDFYEQFEFAIRGTHEDGFLGKMWETNSDGEPNMDFWEQYRGKDW